MRVARESAQLPDPAVRTREDRDVGAGHPHRRPGRAGELGERSPWSRSSSSSRRHLPAADTSTTASTGDEGSPRRRSPPAYCGQHHLFFADTGSRHALALAELLPSVEVAQPCSTKPHQFRPACSSSCTTLGSAQVIDFARDNLEAAACAWPHAVAGACRCVRPRGRGACGWPRSSPCARCGNARSCFRTAFGEQRFPRALNCGRRGLHRRPARASKPRSTNSARPPKLAERAMHRTRPNSTAPCTPAHALDRPHAPGAAPSIAARYAGAARADEAHPEHGVDLHRPHQRRCPSAQFTDQPAPAAPTRCGRPISYSGHARLYVPTRFSKRTGQAAHGRGRAGRAAAQALGRRTFVLTTTLRAEPSARAAARPSAGDSVRYCHRATSASRWHGAAAGRHRRTASWKRSATRHRCRRPSCGYAAGRSLVEHLVVAQASATLPPTRCRRGAVFFGEASSTAMLARWY